LHKSGEGLVRKIKGNIRFLSLRYKRSTGEKEMKLVLDRGTVRGTIAKLADSLGMIRNVMVRDGKGMMAEAETGKGEKTAEGKSRTEGESGAKNRFTDLVVKILDMLSGGGSCKMLFEQALECDC
jgi:hypothetical protein